jgi:hypothetical protein
VPVTAIAPPGMFVVVSVIDRVVGCKLCGC